MKKTKLNNSQKPPTNSNKNSKHNTISSKKVDNNPTNTPKNINSKHPPIQVEGAIKINVGTKLFEMEKNLEKITTYENIIKDQNNKIKILNQGIEPYTKEIESLKSKISELEFENQNLKQDNELKDTEISNYKTKISEEEKIKLEIIESNKKLQQKIVELSQKIDNFKFDNLKDKEEYNNMCKVKNNFEDKIILLTNELEKTKNKLQISENVIKQKDKYIQILINKKNNSNFYRDKINEANSNISSNSKRNDRPQSTGIKNINKHKGKNLNFEANEINSVIVEQENIIKKLKEKIVFLEKDNAGLLIRLKNNNLKNIKK